MHMATLGKTADVINATSCTCAHCVSRSGYSNALQFNIYTFPIDTLIVKVEHNGKIVMPLVELLISRKHNVSGGYSGLSEYAGV